MYLSNVSISIFWRPSCSQIKICMVPPLGLCMQSAKFLRLKYTILATLQDLFIVLERRSIHDNNIEIVLNSRLSKCFSLLFTRSISTWGYVIIRSAVIYNKNLKYSSLVNFLGNTSYLKVSSDKV